jgi:hypothetical protein
MKTWFPSKVLVMVLGMLVAAGTAFPGVDGGEGEQSPADASIAYLAALDGTSRDACPVDPFRHAVAGCRDDHELDTDGDDAAHESGNGLVLKLDPKAASCRSCQPPAERFESVGLGSSKGMPCHGFAPSGEDAVAQKGGPVAAMVEKALDDQVVLLRARQAGESYDQICQRLGGWRLRRPTSYFTRPRGSCNPALSEPWHERLRTGYP